ncbi:MAG: glycosyltransferase family 4 protein [Planctomycetaceae bacterium]
MKVTKLVTVTNQSRLSGVFEFYWQEHLAEHLAAARPDLIVTEANPRFSDMRRLVGFARRHGCPVLGWGLGTTNFFGHGFTRLRHWRRRAMIGRFDGMLCYSELAAKQYQQIGVAAENLHVLYNSCVGRPEVAPAIDERNNAVPTIITIGRLLENKRFDVLIRAAAELKRSGIPVRVQIVGDGSDRERLERIARSSGADVYFPGELRGEELAAIGREADLFALPSLGGLAIQEAMSFGLPIITGAADGTELDLVKNNGWLLPACSPQVLADTIRQAVSDPEELRKRGHESFRIVSEDINLERMVDRFVAAANLYSVRRRAFAA